MLVRIFTTQMGSPVTVGVLDLPELPEIDQVIRTQDEGATYFWGVKEIIEGPTPAIRVLPSEDEVLNSLASLS